MKKLNIGVIGCGKLAQRTHLKYLNNFNSVNLTWACDLSEDTLNTVKVKNRPLKTTNNYLEVINDPKIDAVVIATPILRLTIIEAAAHKGIGVYCEKPFATTVTEMEEIVKIVRDTKTVFCVGNNRHSAPAMIYAKQAFDAAKNNKQRPCWYLDRNSANRESWPQEKQTTILIRCNDDLFSWVPWHFKKEIVELSHTLFEMNHFTDIILWFMAKKPVRVITAGNVDVNRSISIEFEDGSLATIFSYGVGTFSYPKELYEFAVNAAIVVVDHLVEVRTGNVPGFPNKKTFSYSLDAQPEVSKKSGIQGWYNRRYQGEKKATENNYNSEYVLQNEVYPDKGHKAHLAAFLEAVRGDGDSPCDIDTAYSSMKLVFAAIESFKTRKAVSLK